MTATFYVGDAIEVMSKLPEKSVDLVLSSPPFLALRSYLPQDHPDKHLEGGSQSTPGEFIDWLLDVVEACDRVLASHGSLCLELGDTYAGGGGTWDDIKRPHGPDGTPLGGRIGIGWPLAKSLSLIPESFRWAMVYGHNPFTGRQTARWRLRNVIRWVRPNPPVGALGDKFRPATSELMVFCKSGSRYFDLDSVREANETANIGQTRGGEIDRRILSSGAGNGQQNPAGAPPLDWWNIPPGGFSGAHYAVWPPELCVKPIKAMCPESVCRTCGEPRRREVESLRIRTQDGLANPPRVPVTPYDGDGSTAIGIRHGVETHRTTLGFTDCGHDNYRSGVVLDPFAGSGTTLAVASGHGRDSIGVDLDGRNFDLALSRVGPLVLERGEP